MTPHNSAGWTVSWKASLVLPVLAAGAGCLQPAIPAARRVVATEAVAQREQVAPPPAPSAESEEPDVSRPERLGTLEASIAATPAFWRKRHPDMDPRVKIGWSLYKDSGGAAPADGAGMICEVDARPHFESRDHRKGWGVWTDLAVQAATAATPTGTWYVSGDFAGENNQSAYPVLRVLPGPGSRVEIEVTAFKQASLGDVIGMGVAGLFKMMTVFPLFMKEHKLNPPVDRLSGVMPEGPLSAAAPLRLRGRLLSADCRPLPRASLEEAFAREKAAIDKDVQAMAAKPRVLSRLESAGYGLRGDIEEEVAEAASLVGWDDPRVQQLIRRLDRADDKGRQGLRRQIEAIPATDEEIALQAGQLAIQGARVECQSAGSPEKQSLRPARAPQCRLHFTLINRGLAEVPLAPQGGLFSLVTDAGEFDLDLAPTLSTRYYLRPGQAARFALRVVRPSERAAPPLRPPFLLRSSYEQLLLSLKDPSWHAVPGQDTKVRIAGTECRTGIGKKQGDAAEGLRDDLRNDLRASVCVISLELSADSPRTEPTFGCELVTPSYLGGLYADLLHYPRLKGETGSDPGEGRLLRYYATYRGWPPLGRRLPQLSRLLLAIKVEKQTEYVRVQDGGLSPATKERSEYGY